MEGKFLVKFRGKNIVQIGNPKKLMNLLKDVYFQSDNKKYKNFVDFLENCKPKEFNELMKHVGKTNPEMIDTLTRVYHLVNKYTSTSDWEIPDDELISKMIESCVECQLIVRRGTRESFYEHVLKTHSMATLENAVMKNFTMERVEELKKVLERYYLTPIMLISFLKYEKMIPENCLAIINEIYKQDFTLNEILYNYDMIDMEESCTECGEIISQDYTRDWQEHIDDHIGEEHADFMKSMLEKYPELHERIHDIIMPSSEVEASLRKEVDDFAAEISYLPEDQQVKKMEKFDAERQAKAARYFSFAFPYNYMKKREELTLENRIKGEEMVKKMIEIEKEMISQDKPKFIRKNGMIIPISKYTRKFTQETPRFDSFEKARTYARSQNLHSRTDWINHTKTSGFPDTIPISPHSVYKNDGWIDYADFCGFERQVRREPLTKESLKKILKMLDNRWDFYKNYTDGMFTDWFTTQGLFSIKDPIMKTFFTEFISWRHKPEGREAIRYWLVALQDYLETGIEPRKEFGKYSLKQKKEETVQEYLDRQHTRTQDYEFKGLTVDEEPIGIEKIMIEAREVVPTNNDKKWFDIQVDFTVKLLWQGLFQSEDEKQGWIAIQKEKMNGNSFHDAILRTIKLEYQEVKQLNYDKEFYTFGKEPTLFQLYTAWKMRKINGCLNMGSTGTGKTLGAIIAARAAHSEQALVICPKNIVEQWVKNIKKVYANSFVSSGKELHPNFFVSAGKHVTKFHVVNYDKFGREKTAKNLADQIKEGNIDFVIIDEAQFIKKREIDANYESNRRRNIANLIDHIRKYNRKLKVIMLSATPVINNIREGVSLLNMLTGTQYNIPSSNTIRNASRLYTEFQPFSISYLKRNNITEVGRETPIIIEAKIPDEFTEEEIMKFNWLQLEQIATKNRIPKIIEILKNTNGKTVIYTDYVTGIVDQLRFALSEAGFRVGFFIGDDKSGLIEKIGKDTEGNDLIKNRFLTGDIDVLIASRPFAVGIDEIQYVCNNLIFNGLVWTYAEFEQIIGRVVRTGQAKSHVNIHLVLAKINGYDYDIKVKYNRLLQKKAIGDCVRYGTLPEKISFGFTNSERYSTLSEMIKNKESGFPERRVLHLEEKKDMLEEQIKWLELKSK